MFSAQRKFSPAIVMLAALSWNIPAFAVEVFNAPAAPDVAVVPTTVFSSSGRLAPTSPAAADRRNPFGSAPVPTAALASRRGGAGVFNEAQLNGTVASNSATNVVTGTNSISDGAFAGSAGLSTVIQNSGNNVLIQNSTIVNVQLK